MKDSKKLKQIPNYKNDKEAEDFVDNADLSKYDLSIFKPANFEFERKNVQVNMRLPEAQLLAIKQEAKVRNMPYQRFMRELLQNGLNQITHRL
jgi:predicted DNA binding CopG/RHH family protein